MTDDTDTIHVDGATVEVADDPEDARRVATEITVSMAEKASTGDFENVEPRVSVTAALRPAIDLSDRDGLSALGRKINELQGRVGKRVQKEVTRRTP